MGKLVFLIQGPRRTARLNLEGPFFVVGRAEPFPVFHDDPTLSREHATIVDTPDGYLVKDLGSRNGVTINGERIARYGEVPFSEGDLLQAGNTTIRLVDVAELERRSQAAEAEGEQEHEELTVDDAGRTGQHPVVAPVDAEASVEEVGTATELALDDDDDATLAIDDAEPLSFPEEEGEETLEMDSPPTLPPRDATDDLRDLPTQTIEADLPRPDPVDELEARERPLSAEELADLGELAAELEDEIPTQLGVEAAEPEPPELLE